MIQIAVVNQSTVVSDVDVEKCVAALARQVDSDFSPIWGTPANVFFQPRDQVIDLGVWQLIVLDDSDQADALGYHELAADGSPLGKIFAKADLDAGTLWTVTASHELLEMLADPTINLVAEADFFGGVTLFYAFEVCDPCEDDSLGYDISLPDGSTVRVSDFVTPEWFEPTPPPNTAFDKMGKCTAPLQILSGGYISIFDPTKPGWQQVTADGLPGGKAAPPGSRRDRRKIADAEWRRSSR